jgi:hypothetical protein
MALKNAFEDIATEATLDTLKSIAAEIKISNETSEATLAHIQALADSMTYLLSAMFEKMPRLTLTDQLAVNVEVIPVVGVTAAANQTQVLNGLQGIANGVTWPLSMAAQNINQSGVSHIYDNIKVS